MKPFNSAVRCGYFLIFILGSLQMVNAADDVNSHLETLRKKIAANEGAPSQQSQGGPQLSLQIKQLQGFIARADYDRVQQMLGSIRGYGLTQELQDEWLQMVDLLGKEVEKMQAESQEKLSTEVDQLIAETKKGCLEAKSSADLDSLLVRCAALQMRREQQNNVLGERTTRKLAGTASTLSAWANYLDFRASGNSKRANEILRSLRTNDSLYPVLTTQEIEARFVTDDADSLNVRTALVKVFEGVKTPDDLPAAMERMNTYASNPMNPELASLRSEQNRMLATQQAWEAAKKGDDDAAMRALGKIASGGGYENATIYYEALKKQIFSRVLTTKAKKWTKLPQNTNEEPTSYLARILDELQAKNDYATMADVMKFSDQINRESPAGNFTKDRVAIDQFIAAQRFESAGDVLAAVTNYRMVVGSSAGEYAPVAQAQEELKKLQEKTPDVFKSYEGVLVEEMRGLRQQVQMLLDRSPNGRPFPPY